LNLLPFTLSGRHYLPRRVYPERPTPDIPSVIMKPGTNANFFLRLQPFSSISRFRAAALSANSSLQISATGRCFLVYSGPNPWLCLSTRASKLLVIPTYREPSLQRSM